MEELWDNLLRNSCQKFLDFEIRGLKSTAFGDFDQVKIDTRLNIKSHKVISTVHKDQVQIKGPVRKYWMGGAGLK